ncbi:MAG: PQQ-dependent sugar dehydrogenase [Archangium sp.]
MSRLVVAVMVCALFSCSGVAGEHDGGTGGGDATGGGSETGGGTTTGGGSGATGGGSAGGSGGGEQRDAGPQNDGGPGLDARPVNTTCIAPNPPPGTSTIATERVFTNLSFSQPLGFFNAPGDTSRNFVQERQGRIRVFPNVAGAMPNQVTTFLDFSTRVDDQGEGGFLGMAFHPQWPTRLEVFVSYTESSAPLRTVVARYRSTNGGMTLDPASEERVFEIEQPYNNHNGGSINFGPDGYLYIGLGDGGSGDDPLNAGQRLNTNLGKFLRIDVNVPAAQRYAIPTDNPYANEPACNLADDDINDADAGARCAEIYASGMRNPWRWSFDSVSGELWVADVGQGAYEEVDRVVRGGNYGWKIREGAHCRTGAMCQTAGLIDPVVEYGRSLGNSITGGYVYRGTTIPSLSGKFVFGDYGSGRIFSVEPNGQGGSQLGNLLDTNFGIASFGQLADGEVYVLDIGSG